MPFADAYAEGTALVRPARCAPGARARVAPEARAQALAHSIVAKPFIVGVANTTAYPAAPSDIAQGGAAADDAAAELLIESGPAPAGRRYGICDCTALLAAIVLLTKHAAAARDRADYAQLQPAGDRRARGNA